MISNSLHTITSQPSAYNLHRGVAPSLSNSVIGGSEVSSSISVSYPSDYDIDDSSDSEFYGSRYLERVESDQDESSEDCTDPLGIYKPQGRCIIMPIKPSRMRYLRRARRENLKEFLYKYKAKKGRDAVEDYLGTEKKKLMKYSDYLKRLKKRHKTIGRKKEAAINQMFDKERAEKVRREIEAYINLAKSRKNKRMVKIYDPGADEYSYSESKFPWINRETEFSDFENRQYSLARDRSETSHLCSTYRGKGEHDGYKALKRDCASDSSRKTYHELKRILLRGARRKRIY